MNYVIDTNAVLYYLSDRDDLAPDFRAVMDGSEPVHLSVMTKIELLSYPDLEPKDEGIINEFIRGLTICGLDEAVVEKTIAIRKEVRLKIPDAVIAATALVHHAILITQNQEDFRKVGTLRLLAPLVLKS